MEPIHPRSPSRIHRDRWTERRPPRIHATSRDTVGGPPARILRVGGDLRMMGIAHQSEIVDIGRTVRGPRDQVMHRAHRRRCGAVGVGAATVAGDGGQPLPRRRDPRTLPQIQGLALSFVEEQQQRDRALRHPPRFPHRDRRPRRRPRHPRTAQQVGDRHREHDRDRQATMRAQPVRPAGGQERCQRVVAPLRRSAHITPDSGRQPVRVEPVGVMRPQLGGCRGRRACTSPGVPISRTRYRPWRAVRDRNTRGTGSSRPGVVPRRWLPAGGRGPWRW